MSTEAMNLVSTNPAYIPFRLRREFLLYLDTLIEQLNHSGWRVGDTELAIGSYAIEQRVITEVEKEREREDERRELNDGEKISAKFYEQNPTEERFETIPWTQAISQNMRLVIKGSPGSGKTFSTKATVIQKACALRYKISSHSINFDGTFEIPIWITANELAATRKNSIAEALVTILGNKVSRPELKNSFFLRWLRTQIRPIFDGKASPIRLFMVVDALDELMDRETRNFINLAGQLDVPGIHLVATCRTLQWDERRRLLSWRGLRSLELATLKCPQKNRFIQQFFHHEEMRQSAKNLLRNNPSVKYATDNSLLLTFACFLHLDGKLGENSTYIDIYKHIQRMLFDGHWKQDKPKWSDKARQLQDLENIALELFRSNPESNHFTLTEWDDACGILKLTRTKTDRLRNKLIEIGFLVQSGVDDRSGNECWSFLHRTLLEFSSAKALIRQKDWLAQARAHFWDFAWTEVLTYLAGLIDKGRIVQLIIALEDERETHPTEIFGWLVYLEARFIGVSTLRGKDIEKICDLVLYGILVAFRLERVIENVTDKRKPIIHNQNIHEPLIKPAVLSLELNQECSDRIFNRITSNLINIIECGTDWWGVNSASKALGKLGHADPRIIDALLLALTNDHPSVRSVAAQALAELGEVNERIIDALQGALSDPVFNVRNAAAKSFSNFDTADERVIDALALAVQSTDPSVRYYAAEALFASGKADKDLLGAVLADLDSIDGIDSRRAAKVLGTLNDADEQVIDALLTALQNPDYSVRGYAAEALGKVGNSGRKVYDALGAALDDDHPWVRSTAARSLVQLGKLDKKIIEAILPDLTENVASRRRSAAVLLGVCKADDIAIDALRPFLGETLSERGIYAADSLANLGEADDKVLDALVVALNDDRHSWMAAETLSRLATGLEHALDEKSTRRIIQEISNKLDRSTFLLDSKFSTPLFQVWQSYRAHENGPVLTWDLLERENWNLQS